MAGEKMYLDYMVVVKLYGEVDIRMSTVEITQKSCSGGFTVEKRKYVIYISVRNGGTRINISHLFFQFS